MALRGNNFETVRPFIPFHSEILYKSGKGSKNLLHKVDLCKKIQQNHHEIKWNPDLLGTNHWEYIYKDCFRSFQYNKGKISRAQKSLKT